MGHQEEVFAVAWSPSGRRVVSGGRDGLLRVWNPDTGGLLVGLSGHDSYIRSLAFTSDGRSVVTASGDATLRVWDSHPAGDRWRERGRLRREALGAPADNR